ncbi:TPA: hypothetical protein N0F65_010769 [Lagenidium giganteum]|uniref:Uncharacterized protein n=1 Tax=Lagenidium giganteum TaxID=4803 RepID=A0AAV2YIV3_9STRA|nr:TPA: hypothetical protein N0F65_010769 [Lagenidium giganteum]
MSVHEVDLGGRDSTRCCSYGQCKKVVKDSSEAWTLHQCENSGCERVLHSAYKTALLRVVGVGDEEQGHVVCGKRCLNAVKKRKIVATSKPVRRRVAWHDDGPDPSISSLTTKMATAHKIARFIEDRGITTVRTPKDIVNKISTLEQSFRDAVDWLNGTGSGVTDEASLKQGILSPLSWRSAHLFAHCF